jgi:hypothetical protein
MSSMLQHRLRSRTLHRAWHTAAIALVVVAFGATASAAAASVNIVSKNAPPKPHHYNTIQGAVNASTSGDWVLIEPGVYYEEVTVTSAHQGIWIRGMNRNTVILDGQGKAGNGIEIYKANNVWVENLTVRNFDNVSGCTKEGCGNEIWWNGGANSTKIGAHGWYGSYLTAYDTGLNGSYGIFTGHETKGSWDHIYASGFNDAGMYLGACQECEATITGAVMENNALGYSGSNSGGKLAIEYSLFQHNSAGVVPNSENPGDEPPPQDGECNRPEKPTTPTPTISSTNIKRCTIIRNNLIIGNNNLTVPGVGAAGQLWGIGVILPGDYADLVEQNLIINNPNNGVLGLEFPNPFPPQKNTIFFQLAGNRISTNAFIHNGYNPNNSGSAFTGDVTLTGGYGTFFGNPVESKSTNNCVSANVFTDATFPAKIQEKWGCQNETTPNPGYGAFPGPSGLFPESVEYILQNKAESEARHGVGQPAPPPQPTMPNPCEGAPKNPLCT